MAESSALEQTVRANEARLNRQLNEQNKKIGEEKAKFRKDFEQLDNENKLKLSRAEDAYKLALTRQADEFELKYNKLQKNNQKMLQHEKQKGAEQIEKVKKTNRAQIEELRRQGELRMQKMMNEQNEALARIDEQARQDAIDKRG